MIRPMLLTVLYSILSNHLMYASQYTSTGILPDLRYANDMATGDIIGLCSSANDGIVVINAPSNVFISEESAICTRLLLKERKYVHSLVDNDSSSITALVSGVSADCRFLMNQIKSIINDFKTSFSDDISLDSLINECSSFYHSLTTSESYRPLSAHIILLNHNKKNKENSIIKFNSFGDYNYYKTALLLPSSIQTNTDQSDDIYENAINKLSKQLKDIEWNIMSCQEIENKFKAIINDVYNSNTLNISQLILSKCNILHIK